ncbi:hypothetical protein Tco_1144197 [Tanacetum coccineum]
MVEDYQWKFEKLMNRVTDIPDSLRICLYISGLKLHLQRELLASKPITLGYVFSLARIIEARFKAISEKEQNIKEKADTYLPLQSELASPKIKGSLNADEDIGVDEVSSAIDGVFDLGESNVESMEVRSKFGEFLENKKSVEEVVGRGEALGVGEDDDSGNATIDGGDDAVESGVISILNSLIGHGSPLHKEEKDEGCNSKKIIGSRNQDNFFRHHLEDKVVFEGVESVTPVVQEDGRPKRSQMEKSKPNIRVILFSIYSDDENSSSVNIKQHCGWSSQNQRYKRRCCSLIPAESDSLPHAHAQGFKVKHSAS